MAQPILSYRGVVASTAGQNPRRDLLDGLVLAAAVFDTCLGGSMYHLHTDATDFWSARWACSSLHGPDSHLARPSARDQHALTAWLLRLRRPPVPWVAVNGWFVANGSSPEYAAYAAGEDPCHAGPLPRTSRARGCKAAGLLYRKVRAPHNHCRAKSDPRLLAPMPRSPLDRLVEDRRAGGQLDGRRGCSPGVPAPLVQR